VIRQLDHRQRDVPIGSLEITLIATPGHADGHVVYLLRDGMWRCIFVGA